MRVVAILVCAVSVTTAQGAGMTGETFRVTGTWSGQVIEAQRLQLRDTESDTAKAQIMGRLQAPQSTDSTSGRFEIGPLVVRWLANTTFKDISPALLQEGVTVRVAGRMEGEILVASVIALAAAMPVDAVQLTGLAVPAKDADGREDVVTMLGQTVRLNQPGYNRLDSLTQRQDSRRPAQPFGFDLFGRRASLTGEYDLSYRDRNNLRLDGHSHVQDLDHELKLEFLYPVSDRAWLFLSAKGVYEDEIYRAGSNGATSRYLARDQTWLYVDRIADSGFSLQVGRINVAEAREWWWDDDLDAIRVMHDRGPWHTEVSLAHEMVRERTDLGDVDPELKGVTRALGRASWLWASKQTVDLFAMYTRDRSSTPGIGRTLPEDNEDPSDARLNWLGVRALGDRTIGDYGDLRYWADAAWMEGREVVTEYDNEDGISTVTKVTKQKVRGTAFDLGLSWETRLPLRPSFTLAYARGSGDGKSSDGIDHAFRQTGLHNNKWRFHGVNRFHHYGELLRPELSNLAISTMGLGVTLGNARSLDLVYHRYQQDEPAKKLRDARVSPSLDGKSTDVGEELDLVLGTREWSHVELALTGSMFRAGKAYGSKAGEHAYQILFEMAVNF